MDWLSELFGGGGSGQNNTQDTTNKWEMAPDYAESAAARGTWGDTLKNWSTQPGYGAIAPNWDSIWQNAAKKVQQYFHGGPMGPGAEAGVKSNLAGRGMSENPAAEETLGRLGMQEGQQLGDMAVNQATQEANFGEQGRTTWLNSIMQLAGLKPQMLNTGSTVSREYQQPSFLNSPTGKSVGTGLSDMLGGGQGSDLISMISGLFGGGAGSIGSADSGSSDSKGGGFDWGQLAQVLGPMAMAMMV